MKFCVYTICKNEIDNISTWLDNMSNADYMMILDTGSTDGTWELLNEKTKEYQNLIIHQKKYDNFRFDIARNDSLEYAPEDVDYFIMMDMDERFMSKDWIKTLKEIWFGNYDLGYLWYIEQNRFFLKDKKSLYLRDKIHNKKYKWKYPVYEILYTDESVKKFLPHMITNLNWKDLIVIHEPKANDNRNCYYDLSELRLKEYEKDPMSYIICISNYYDNNELDKGMELIDKAKMIITDEHVLSELYLFTALYYEKLNKLEKAAEAYMTALYFKKDNFVGMYMAFNFYEQHFPEAFERIVQSFDKDVEVLSGTFNELDETTTCVYNYLKNIKKNKSS